MEAFGWVGFVALIFGVVIGERPSSVSKWGALQTKAAAAKLTIAE